jgi:transposase-like protein
MKCPACRIRQLVVIEIQVGGEPVTLYSCSHCDRRWWQGMEGSLSLENVLGIAAQGA